MGNPDAEPKSPVPEVYPRPTTPPTGVPMPLPVVQPPPPYRLQPASYGPWSANLFNCDCRRFCISFWCPCITFGEISEIIDRGSSSCGTNGAIYFLILWLTGCAFIYSCVYRGRMRELYLLEGDPCEDCLLHLCCEPCSLTQMYQELQNRGFDVSLGWHGNVERQTQGVAMLHHQITPPVVQGGMRR